MCSIFVIGASIVFIAMNFEDGKRLNARFNFPSQICFELDGIMYIADSSNHCIRSIDREGAVSTVIGVPGRAGYVDGTPDDALFDEPWE